MAGLLAFVGGVLNILSLPPVRNYIWDRLVKGGERVIDAKATEVKEAKKKGIFG